MVLMTERDNGEFFENWLGESQKQGRSLILGHFLPILSQKTTRIMDFWDWKIDTVVLIRKNII